MLGHFSIACDFAGTFKVLIRKETGLDAS